MGSHRQGLTETIMKAGDMTPGRNPKWMLSVQSWAAMEEKEGALQRATELRSFRMQGINDIVLPSNFGISLSQEPADSPLKAVVATVSFATIWSTTF